MFSNTTFKQWATLGLTALLAPGLAQADTFVVDAGGAGDFLTIQAAIDAAADGDQIIVTMGTYAEDLIVDVSVQISGAGMGLTTVIPATAVPGAGAGSQLTTTTWLARVQADNVTFNGLTFDGNNPNIGGSIDARGGIVTDFTAGTYSGLEVISCEVTNVNFRGIYAAAGGSGHSFLFNTVSNIDGMTYESVGLFFYGAEGQARNNVVSNCSIGIGFQAGGGGLIASNDISDCDLAVLSNASDQDVDIRDNDIDNCDLGIQVITARALISVDDNDVFASRWGISLLGGGNGLMAADGNIVDGNSAPNAYGFYVSTDSVGSLNALLTSNVIKNNSLGIVLAESPMAMATSLNVTISGSLGNHNTFMGNTDFNLVLDTCNDNVNARNNVWGAVVAAQIELGIYHQLDDIFLGLVDFSDPNADAILVDDDGTGSFLTINPAVEAILPGGIITVLPGLYVEDVVVDRACLIQGSGTSSDPLIGTVLRGQSVDANMVVMSITGDGVFVDNLRVDGQQAVFTSALRGICATDTFGVNITNCVVHTAKTGICFIDSSAASVRSCEVFDSGASPTQGGGILFSGTDGEMGGAGEGNSVHDCVAPGILLTAGSRGLVAANAVSNCPVGFLSSETSGNSLFNDNTAVTCTTGFQSNSDVAPVGYNNNRATGGLWGYTLFVGANPHSYTDNQAESNAVAGILLSTENVAGDGDVNAILRGNRLRENGTGVLLSESGSSFLFDMNVDMNGSGNANWIQDNTSQDISLVGCDDDVDARNNHMGSTLLSVIEGNVNHQVDNGALGLVDFSGLTVSHTYCKVSTTFSGCMPTMSSVGLPSMTNPSPFTILATDVPSNEFGIMFFGISGPLEQPQFGSTLCVGGTLMRTGAISSGGVGSGNCSGVLAYNFNPLIQSGAHPILMSGVTVNTQFWHRDPPSAFGTGFTDGLTFTILP